MSDAPEDARDEDLLAAHVAGDPHAFGRLVARHRDRLWAVALRTTGDPEEAADGLQDGLVAAYRRAASFRGDAAVTTWLHRVVVNACLDRLRAAAVRRTVALPEDHDAPLGPAAGESADPERHAEAAERRRAVLAGLAQLPVDQRAALVLVDMEGMSVQEAADVLGVPVGTVKSRCSRGRARLAGLFRAAGLLPPLPPEPAPRGNPGHPATVRSSRAAPRGPPG